LLSTYTITDLGANLIPTALNNGQVAGEFVDTSAHPNGGAFLWSQGTLTDLPRDLPRPRAVRYHPAPGLDGAGVSDGPTGHARRAVAVGLQSV
jgi:hypothetical protein